MPQFAGRTTEHEIEKLFVERWSPRAFAPDSIDDATIGALFEAARWAPSSYNSQPWRFLYGKRGTPAFDKILGLLVPGNQAWAKHAALLIVVVSKLTMAPRGEEIPSYSHSFDTGAAWQNLALEGAALGWHAHGMTGLDIPRATTELGVPEGYRVEAAIAVGKLGDKSQLPEGYYRDAETPNGRNPVSSFAFEGDFPKA